MGNLVRTIIALMLLGLTASGATDCPEVVWPDFNVSQCLPSCVVLGSFISFKDEDRPRTPIGIWEDTVSKSPGKPRPHLNLGRAYQESGRYDDALREFRAAIVVSRDVSARERLIARQLAAVNMAQIYLRFGELNLAESVLVEVWNEDPGFPGIANNLAVVYFEQNRYQMALEVLDAGISNLDAYPYYIEQATLWFNRGIALQILGQCVEADGSFRMARSLDRELLPRSECKS